MFICEVMYLNLWSIISLHQKNFQVSRHFYPDHQNSSVLDSLRDKNWMIYDQKEWSLYSQKLNI